MPEPRRILEHLGFDEVDAIDAVTGGADARLYRVRSGGATYALRVLGPGRHGQAANENRYLQHATSHGIAGPRLIVTGSVDECPASLMTWIEGQTLSARVLGQPDLAGLPEQFAMWQRRIHALPLPDQAQPAIAWRRALPDELIAALEREPPHPPTVVHLDYHPMNCMANGDDIVAVLDWANAGVADPRYDVARSLAILTHVPVPDPSQREPIAAFRQRYLAAYGGDPLPAVFRWWAGVTMAFDLAPNVGHPDIAWLTPAWMDAVHHWAEAARQETLRNA